MWGLNIAHHHVDSLPFGRVSGRQHGIGFPIPGRIPEKNAEMPPAFASLLMMDDPEQLVGIETCFVHRIPAF